jgi:membrane-associated phospholipid phosphatase
LRIPVVILSTLIILSTMTGGWHYFIDVLAGLLLAVAAIAASRALSRWHTPVTAADGNHS